MGSAKTATWVLGTVFVALILLAFSWLFAISPRLESAAEMNDQTESEQSRVDQLEIQLAGLKQDFENIEEFRTELAALRLEVPAGVELAQLTRQVNALASTAGVTVVSLQANSPTPVLVAAVPVPAEPTPETPEGDATAATEPLTDSAPAAEPTASTTYVVQLSIGTLGTYEQSLAFLTSLQTGNPRLLLVSAVQVTSQDETGAQAGRPALAAGDLELRLVVFAIVLPDTSGTAIEEPGDVFTELPVPSGQPNPFEPLG